MTQEPLSGRHSTAEPLGQTPYVGEPGVGQVEPGPQVPAQQVPAEPLEPSPVPVDQGAAPGEQPTVRRSRFGGLWVGLIVAALILVLLLVFILQNSQSVQIDFFGLSGQAPLAVAILLGVAAGALLVAIPGSVRILQLRRAVKHDHRA
jgi:putative membrane protein